MVNPGPLPSTAAGPRPPTLPPLMDNSSVGAAAVPSLGENGKPRTEPPFVPPPSGCAAGRFCTAVLPLGNSTHRCDFCGGLIHCLMFCGKPYSEAVAEINVVGEFNPLQLSPLGRHNYYVSFKGEEHRMSVCHQCIERCTRIMVRPVASQASGEESSTTEEPILDVRTFVQAERAKHPEINMLHYLLALSTCLSPEERQENRLEEFQKKKWLSKVQCKPPKKTYVAVVKFHIELINFNEQDLNKEERTFPRIPRLGSDGRVEVNSLSRDIFFLVSSVVAAGD